MFTETRLPEFAANGVWPMGDQVGARVAIRADTGLICDANGRARGLGAHSLRVRPRRQATVGQVEPSAIGRGQCAYRPVGR